MTQTPGKRPARRPGVRDGAERPFAARMGGGDKETRTTQYEKRPAERPGVLNGAKSILIWRPWRDSNPRPFA